MDYAVVNTGRGKFPCLVIPGCAPFGRRTGIHAATGTTAKWIPGSRFASPGMTDAGQILFAMPSMKRSRIAAAVRSASGAATPQKVAVDIHPGKAIDQRAPGDLDLSEVGGAELAGGKGVGKRPLGQRDQLGIVSGNSGHPVMVEQAAGGNDLEMGRVAHRPAQIGKAEGAKATEGVTGR